MNYGSHLAISLTTSGIGGLESIAMNGDMIGKVIMLGSALYAISLSVYAGMKKYINLKRNYWKYEQQL